MIFLNFSIIFPVKHYSTQIADDFTVKTKTPFLGNAISVLMVKPKRGWCVFWLFFKVGICSAISFKRSRRELSIDVAELWSMLKNYQYTHYPFWFHKLKSVYSIPQNGGLFLLCFQNFVSFPTPQIRNCALRSTSLIRLSTNPKKSQ